MAAYLPMPRGHRHSKPGATYHVICRGNQKQRIFQSDRDCERFCELMAEGVKRYDHKIVAYCLMSNHVHIAVKVGKVDLSRVFHNLLFRYAQGYNLKYDSCGHVFHGRFKSKLVDSTGYCRSLIRYIHLNPVKANLVDLPEQFEWSSHRAYTEGGGGDWLSPKLGLHYFGRTPDEAIDMFSEFVRHGVGRNESFDFDLGQLCGRLRALTSAVARRFGVRSSELTGDVRGHKVARARAGAALLAKRLGGISQREIAAHFGQSPAVLSKSVVRLETRLEQDHNLRAKIEGLYQTLALY